MFIDSYDPQDFSGNRSGKDLFGHTPIGLFFGILLDYFSFLYHSIGEISGMVSGKVKMMVKLGYFSDLMYLNPSERFPEKNPDRKYF
jgi:hypothetical protein